MFVGNYGFVETTCLHWYTQHFITPIYVASHKIWVVPKCMA